MDTKLMKISAVILVLSLVFSCSTIKGTKDINTYYGDNFFYIGSRSSKARQSNMWVTDYKQTAFSQCLFKAYKNDTIFKMIQKEDLFLEGVIPMELWTKINADSQKIADNIPVTEYYSDADDKDKKHILETCLCYFSSRQLDSIAKQAYKEYIKKSN